MGNSRSSNQRTPNYDYPRTVQEMLDQGWYEKILAKVRKAKLNDVLNTPEEIVQDIFLQIMQSRYLERYNPELRPFEVYIYVLVSNSIKKRGEREGTENGRKIVNRNSLEYEMDGEDGGIPGVTYLDHMDQGLIEDGFAAIEIQDLIDRTRKSLRVFKASSKIIKEDGREISRDPETVFDLLLSGKTVSEIAALFETSNQFIYILLGKIRETKEMKEFHARLKCGGEISSRGKRKVKSWANATF